MNNNVPNLFTNSSSQSYSNDIRQKAEQLKQNEQQMEFQNVQQYVLGANLNNYTNLSSSVEENAKNLRLQDAKNYIQQMNSKMGLQ